MNKKAAKIIKKTLSAIGFLVMAAVMIAVVSIAIQLFSGDKPSLFGYRFYYILTDSMTPGLAPNDIILAKERRARPNLNDLKLGDVVTFVSTSGTQNGMTITHRVVKEPYYDEALQTYVIITRGDKVGANDDPPTPILNVEAKMCAKAHVITALYNAIKTPVGFVFLLVVPILLLIVFLVLHTWFDIKKKQREEASEKAKQNAQDLERSAIDAYKQKLAQGEDILHEDILHEDTLHEDTLQEDILQEDILQEEVPDKTALVVSCPKAQPQPEQFLEKEAPSPEEVTEEAPEETPAESAEENTAENTAETTEK